MKTKLLYTIFASVILMSAYANAAKEEYTFDANHTSVLWSANHFGFSNPMGRFGIKSGTLMLDEKSPQKSKVDVVMDMTSLTTGIEAFNHHLSSTDFLDVIKFPTATFKSTNIEITGADTAKITGKLTLHGITKPVTLEAKLNKIGESPMTKLKTAGFSAVGTIKRSDFGISAYVPHISDEVKLQIEAEAVFGKGIVAKKN